MGAHQIFRPGPTRDGYRRGEPLIPATSSWERHAHPTELHSDQWLATRGWLLQECAQPFGGGQGENNGWNMVEPSALMRPTTGVLDISWFLTRKQCFLLSSLHGYWMLLGFGSKMWYQFSDENHPFLSMFGIIFWPYPGWITLDCPFGIAWILVLGDFIIRQQSCPHFSSSKSDLGGCGNPWLPCSPVVPHSGQSAACLSVGPKRLCERGGGGRTWKDTWRVLGRMNHKNGGLHVEN